MFCQILPKIKLNNLIIYYTSAEKIYLNLNKNKKIFLIFSKNY